MRYFEDLNKDSFVHAINVKEGRSHKLPIQNKASDRHSAQKLMFPRTGGPLV